MKETINVAIIGFGNIARSHYLGITSANLRLNLPFNLRVSHIISYQGDVVTIDKEQVYESLDKAMASNEKIDLIDICNINEAHLDSIKAAIKYNVPIYCEKPLTSTIQESKEACKLVTDKHILNGVPLIFRYIPSVHMLKASLAKQELGAVIDFKATFYHDSYLAEEKRSSWRAKKTSGGGTSIDLSIHMIDTIRFIFGEIKESKTIGNIYFDNVDNDEVAQTTITCENNIKGFLETSRIYNQYKQKCEIEVFCEHGSYVCNILNPYQLILNYFKGDTLIRKVKNEKINQYVVSEGNSLNYHQDAHTASIADIARKIYNDSASGFGATFKDALIAQTLITVK